jgi:hypothetical protein
MHIKRLKTLIVRIMYGVYNVKFDITIVLTEVYVYFRSILKDYYFLCLE